MGSVDFPVDNLGFKLSIVPNMLHSYAKHELKLREIYLMWFKHVQYKQVVTTSDKQNQNIPLFQLQWQEAKKREFFFREFLFSRPPRVSRVACPNQGLGWWYLQAWSYKVHY